MDYIKYVDETDADKRCVIYLLTCMPSGKVYVGQTIKKLRERLVDYRIGHSSEAPIFRAIRRYGRAAFAVQVLETCDDIDVLNVREVYWIAHYRSCERGIGYNLQVGGHNSPVHEDTKKILAMKCSGWHHTEEAKRKIGASSRGSNHPNYGKTFSAEYCKKLSDAHKGHKHTAVTRAKMSATRKGRKITWGDKISKAKIKTTKEQLVAAVKANPTWACSDLCRHFNISKTPITCAGGIGALRKAAGVVLDRSQLPNGWNNGKRKRVNK